jgi:hypothetical protein
MSIKAIPERLSTTFNTNYYFQDGDYLGNTGKQKLRGSLQLDNETVYQDEIVYGQSTVGSEPLVMSVTDPSLLQANHLVSKSYVDSRTNGYLQVFTFGRAYTGVIDPNFMVNLNNYVYVRFQNTNEKIQSLYVEVIYDVQKGKRYSLDRNDAIQRRSLYNIVFYQSTFNTFDKSTIDLVGGDDLTKSFGNYTPLAVGTQNGACLIRFQFSPTTPTINSGDDWYSTYGISIRILKSNGLTYNSSVGQNAGNAYFATN